MRAVGAFRAREEPNRAQHACFGAEHIQFGTGPGELGDEPIALAAKVSDVVVQRRDQQIHLGVSALGVAPEPEDFVAKTFAVAVERERLKVHADWPGPAIWAAGATV